MTASPIDAGDEAARLRRLGDLACGLAHEINTPMQYIGDNARFLSEAVTDLRGMLAWYQACVRVLAQGRHARLLDEMAAMERRIDLEHLLAEMPTAILHSLEGIAQVAASAAAFREYVEAGDQPGALDLAHAVEVALNVSRNDWRRHAELEPVSGGDQPRVLCAPRVLLPLLVELVLAAAAAADGGKVTVSTRRDGAAAVVDFSAAAAVHAQPDAAAMRTLVAPVGGGVALERAVVGWRMSVLLPGAPGHHAQRGGGVTSHSLLFVDDEPRVIDGIRRMLRPLRDEWRVLTATSGPEALAILDANEVDVVMSDMRMPGMDGAELLQQVMRRHPSVVRIILSGQSDNESIMRSIGPTHQYLSKPCAPEMLRATLARACALRDMLNHEGVASIISRMSSLPSLPGAYSEVIAELRSSQPSLPRIASIISGDIGMSAKVLQLVNFSMLRDHRAISSPLDAATALGIDNLRTLVLTAGVFEQAGDDPAMSGLWEHGKIVGTIAKAIAEAEGRTKEEAELCFTAGVLHDCGRLVLCSHYSETVENKRISQRLTLLERKRFGASHPQIGAYLLGLWGLPYTLVEAVAHHHRPEALPGTGFTTLTAVHVAEFLAVESGRADALDGVELDRDYLSAIGMMGRLDAWRAAAAAALHDTESKP